MSKAAMNHPPSQSVASWRQRLQVLDAFEQAWRRGERPRVEDCLSDEPSGRHFLVGNLALVELEYRLRNGEPARVEEYVLRFPELATTPKDVLELILAERRCRCHEGEAFGADEYAERFPKFAVVLAQRLAESATSLGTEVSETPRPAINHGDLPERVGRFRIEDEIARGGMGKVVRVHDESFQRSMALKVLLRHDPANPEQGERFLREARLTGQLQHPGIPPVQEMGKLPDGRPYFIMKLVKGRSLDALLRDRSSPSQDLPRFLNIFEQVCQTLGYAHDRGVIHRDLKPANIMVGAFGEVQVMDWGLAKLLSEGRQEARSDASERPATVFTLASSSMKDGETAAGSVMGTPAYMAPEQARGEVENLDTRADVFGLGGILCDVLTGKAPFASGSAIDSHRQAMKGDLSSAFARLEACGADAEIVDMARKCLAPDREQRFADAAAVAQAMAKYQIDLQARLKQAEIDRAAAEVKAAEEHKQRQVERARAMEERRRRRATMALAGSLLLLVLGAGAAGIWYQREQARQEAEELSRQAESLRKRDLAAKGISDALQQARQTRRELHAQLAKTGGVFELLNNPIRWQGWIDGARAALERARALHAGVKEDIDESLAKEIQEVANQLRQDDAERGLAMQLDEARIKGIYRVGNTPVTPLQRYETIFRQAGLPVLDADGKEKPLADRIRQSPIKEQLVASLDDWSFGWNAAELVRERLKRVTRLADPDPLLNQFRDRAVRSNSKELRALASKVLADRSLHARLSPNMLFVVGALLLEASRLSEPPWRLADIEKEAENWLRASQLLYPSDFWINFQLGLVVSAEKPVDAAGFYRAALAVRNDTSVGWSNLATTLERLEDWPAAIAAYRRALNLNPRDSYSWACLGNALRRQGDDPGASAAAAKAVAVWPLGVTDDRGPLHWDIVVSEFIVTRFTGMDWKNPKREHVHDVELRAGVSYVIDLSSIDIDCYLRLEDSQGKVLEQSEKTNKTTDSRLYFVAKMSGKHRLVAASSMRVFGDYTLVVREFRRAKK